MLTHQSILDMYTAQMWETYHAGAQAFKNGEPRSSNPMIGPGLHFGAWSCWSRGWADAEELHNTPAPPVNTARRVIVRKRARSKHTDTPISVVYFGTKARRP